MFLLTSLFQYENWNDITHHSSVSSILTVMLVILSTPLVMKRITFFPESAEVWLDLGSSHSFSRNSRRSGSVRSEGCEAVRARKRSRAARLRSTN